MALQREAAAEAAELAEAATESLFSVYLHLIFWQIFRHTALNFLGIPPVFLRKFALSDEKSAQNLKYSQTLKKLYKIPVKLT